MWALSVVLVIGVVGFLVLPPIVKSILLDRLSESLQRRVSIESISINPYALSLQVDGLSIDERGGGEKVAGFDQLYLNLEAMSLFRGGPVVSELRLAGPMVRVVRLPDGSFNFSDLLDAFVARPPSDDPVPAFSVNNIQISGGRLEFDDHRLGEKHRVDDLNVALPFVSSLPSEVDSFVEPAISLSIDGSPLAFKGRSRPFADSLDGELSLDLRDVQLGRYVGYLPFRLPIEVVSAGLDSELKLVFRRAPAGRPSTAHLSGRAALKDVVVRDAAGGPLLSLARLDVVVDEIDPLKRRLAIERVQVEAPEIHARVSREGVVDWIEFFSQRFAGGSGRGEAQGAEAAAVPEWSLGEIRVTRGSLHWLDESHGEPFNATVDDLDLTLQDLDARGASVATFAAAWRLRADPWVRAEAFAARDGRLDMARQQVTVGEVLASGARLLIRRTRDGAFDFVKPPSLKLVEASQKAASTPWKLTFARVHGENLELRFEDAAVSPAAVQVVRGATIDAENLTTEPGQTARLSARFALNAKGQVEAGGTIGLFPLEADLSLDARSLELLPLQPYFTEKVNIDVTRGQVSLNGALKLREAKDSTGELSGGFSGQVTIGDFYAVDKLNSADFLKWKSLFLGKLDLRVNPALVSIGEVALSDFFARVIISRDGKLNLLQIVRQPGSTASPEPAKAVAPVAVSGEGRAQAPVAAGSRLPVPVNVGKIVLQGGNILFSDNFVKPNYSANLRKVGGTVSGLSSTMGSLATVDLRGSYDNTAPVTIAGQINPLSEKPYLNLQAEVRGIEMTSLSPYSGKYAGYAIEKGKLSLFVRYRIEDNQLTAENRVFLDQLTFGNPVDSPDATKLPVTLAVALLKNSRGEIDINLPISGSLDDPEFSVGGLIVRVIVNLLVKAASAPFALLGSIFGGGEELSNVEFEVGQATLTDTARQRLETLAKALADRPALRLEIEGRADSELDPEGLRRSRLEHRVRAMKREDLTRQGVESGSAESVEVGAKEYPVLLERVYRAEKFPKPRNFVGMVRSLPVDEMEKLILANTQVDEEDLRDLAERRARAVVDWLGAHDLPAERIFLLPARVVTPDAAKESPGTSGESRVALSLK
ncbi:DUF748 domain-containing protein [Accumulibacter sp.]|uniref:DUF748 domain-containing protein n=1 Tax=Accumulibacter sp. TaxID=2053492 RepID=UPI0025DEAB4E|nr:DUF748 domain-containing protein [Accumulibacter sp.]MCM8596835.1 DUF748 domain-containing protein [Accumulibacter sp.]MCM8624631.1 DUF748 domain-containing protein [Accumulibacter sp.]MDS4050983.1 DUF748 domain-containing protein [Accumulibacter sp.]